MKIAGIICEFNPFHNGHKYIIDKIREENDCLICVMSGNFVQRGEPALFPKHTRANAALSSGADLVIELPSPWSASFAENFALGAISLLKEAGINTLYFGSESGSIDKLMKIAEIDKSLKIKDSKDLTYAKLREHAIKDALGKEFSDILRGANDILGIEYIKAAKKLSANFKIKTIKRISATHDSTEASDGICSASFIRENIENPAFLREYTPPFCYKIYSDEISKGSIIDAQKYSDSAISYLRRLNDFSRLPDISEGLDMKLKKELSAARTLEELQASVKSKRYTLSRIRRIILSAFLNIDNSYCGKTVPYINILGMTKSGERALKNISKCSSLPLIFSGKSSSPLDKEVEMLFNDECTRNDIYASLLKKASPCGLDFTEGIIKL